MAGLFSKPKVPDPTPIPDANSAEVVEARRRKQAEIIGRSGRMSTDLSGGGATYANSLLGD